MCLFRRPRRPQSLASVARRASAAPVAAIAGQPRAALHSFRERASFAQCGAQAVVYVAGAVARPGLYRLPAGARVDDAVRRAGGLRARCRCRGGESRRSASSDGEEIRVPRVGEAARRSGSDGALTRKTRARAVRRRTIDLNAADAAGAGIASRASGRRSRSASSHTGA